MESRADFGFELKKIGVNFSGMSHGHLLYSGSILAKWRGPLMNETRTNYDDFKSLHDQKNPLLLYNCWDVASAKAIEQAGSKAIATSSYSMAEAWGYTDGEQLSFEQVLWMISRIAEHVVVPLTVDIEGGYAVDEDTLANNMEQLFRIVICGINFEDQKVNH